MKTQILYLHKIQMNNIHFTIILSYFQFPKILGYIKSHLDEGEHCGNLRKQVSCVISFKYKRRTIKGQKMQGSLYKKTHLIANPTKNKQTDSGCVLK